MNEVAEYIKGRIARNKNFLCGITGPTGSGKSYSAIAFAEELDPSFHAKRIVFDIKAFMMLINSGKLQKGSVIVLDEFGVTHSAYSWQSLESKLFLYLMQTFRNMNLIVFFTVPHLSFISAGSRRLLHAHFETVSINPSSKKVILKPLFAQINQRTGDIYLKYLRLPGKFGQRKINRLEVGLPSPGLIVAYEAQKKAYTEALNKSILEELESKEQKVGRKDIETRYQEHRDQVLRELGKEKNLTSIAAALNTNTATIKEYLERLTRDGYELLTKTSGKRTVYWGFKAPVPFLRKKKENSTGLQLDSGGTA